MAVSPQNLQDMQDLQRRLEEEEKRRKMARDLQFASQPALLDTLAKSAMTGPQPGSRRQAPDYDLTRERSVFDKPATPGLLDGIGDWSERHPDFQKAMDEWFRPEAIPEGSSPEDIFKHAIKTPILPPAITRPFGKAVFETVTGAGLLPESAKESLSETFPKLSQVYQGAKQFSGDITGSLLTPQSLATVVAAPTPVGPFVIGAQLPEMGKGTVESGKRFMQQYEQGDIPGATASALETGSNALMTLLGTGYVGYRALKPVIVPKPTAELFTPKPEAPGPSGSEASPPPPSQPPPSGIELSQNPQTGVYQQPTPGALVPTPARAPMAPQSEILGGGLGGLQKIFEKTGNEAILDQAEVAAKKSGKKITEELAPEGQPLDPNLYADAMNRQRDVAKKGAQPTTGERINDFYRDAKAKIVDGISPIEDAINYSMKKHEGQFTVLPRYRFTNQYGRVLQSDAIAKAFARDNGLFDVIQAPKDTVELGRLGQYLIARHHMEVAELGMKTGKTREVGRDFYRDTQMLDQFDQQYPHFKDLANQISGYSQKLLDAKAEAGLISKESYQRLKELYPNYVPFDRVFDPAELELKQTGSARGPASLSQTSAQREMKGSTREIEDPFVSLLSQTGKTVAEAEINKAANAIVDTINFPDNPLNLKPLRTAENVKQRINIFQDLAETKPIKLLAEKTISRYGNQINLLAKEIGGLEKEGLQQALKPEEAQAFPPRGRYKTRSLIETFIELPDQAVERIKGKIDTRDAKMQGLMSNLDDLRAAYDGLKQHRATLFDEAKLARDAESRGKATVSRYVDGIKEIYEIEPWVAKAAKNLNAVQMGLVEKMMRGSMRLARTGMTALNIPFTGSNLLRDVGAAFVQAPNWRVSVATNPLLSPITAVRSFVDALGHGKWMQEMDRQGSSGALMEFGTEQLPKSISDIRAKGGAKILYYPLRAPVKTLEHFISSTEKMTRLSAYKGEYKRLRGEGMNETDAKAQAAETARKVTVDFNRKGDWGRVLNSVFLFFNAQIQGSRAFMRSWKERPAQTAMKVMMSQYLPTIALTLYNLSDPERRKKYQQIDEIEKQKNMTAVLPGATWDPAKKVLSGIAKIPLPQEWAPLNNLVRREVEHIYGDAPQITAKEAFDAITGSVSPIGLNANQLASTFTPQMVKPALEIFTNKNFYSGKPVKPAYMEGMTPQEQVFPWTSGTARQIGGLVDRSPIDVEHMVGGHLGGVGMQLLNLADRAQNLVRPEDKQIPVGGQSILESIKQRFTRARASEPLPEEKADIGLMGKYQTLTGFENREAKKEVRDRAEHQIQLALKSTENQQKLKEALDKYKEDPAPYNSPQDRAMRETKRLFDKTFGRPDETFFEKMDNDSKAQYLFFEKVFPEIQSMPQVMREDKIKKIGKAYGVSENVTNRMLDIDEAMVSQKAYINKKPLKSINERLQERDIPFQQ